MRAAIVQARMGSTRCPNKVLAPICGHPMLWHILKRLGRLPGIERLIVATSIQPSDDAIVEFCQENGFTCFRGSEPDVLDRYYHAARHQGVDTVVRITADCPVIDPEVVQAVVALQSKGPWDYASNTIDRTYPDGLDVEAFTFDALEIAWQEATLMSEREHVTPYIWKHPERFKQCQLTQKDDLSTLRWTVDEPEDLAFIRKVYEFLYDDGRLFMMKDILELLRLHPELSEINRGFTLNAGYHRSVQSDRVVWTPGDDRTKEICIGE